MREQLLAHRISFDDDEQLFYRDDILGHCRLLDVEDAVRAFADTSWFSLADQGAWLGRPVGFFCWTHMLNEHVARAHLLPALMWTCRGTVARPDTGEVRRFVSERELSLRALTSKFGFDDGDAFPSGNDDRYLDYVVHEAERALASAGLEGHVGLRDSHHNPLRLSGELTRAGALVPDFELTRHCLRLWLFNLPVLEEIEFWFD